MDDEDSLVEDVAESQAVKGMRPHVESGAAVFGLDLAVEAVQFVHVAALVVASVQEDTVWLHQLVDVESQDALD